LIVGSCLTEIVLIMIMIMIMTFNII